MKTATEPQLNTLEYKIQYILEPHEEARQEPDATPDPDNPRRRPKGDKRERTRAQLVEAAAAVIGEKGWDRTSLDEVARRAGMSRGAIYGNFKDREELFLAVVQTRWKPVMPPYTPGTTFQQHLHAVGKAVAAVGPARRAQALGALSFMLYALTHEEMRSAAHGVEQGGLSANGGGRREDVSRASNCRSSPRS